MDARIHALGLSKNLTQNSWMNANAAACTLRSHFFKAKRRKIGLAVGLACGKSQDFQQSEVYFRLDEKRRHPLEKR